MSRPTKLKSLEGATSTGPGESLDTAGRITLSLFVVTDTSPSSLDVDVEVSMDGNNWTQFQDEGGAEELSITTSDFSSTGSNYAAFVSAHGIAAHYIRANITTYSSAGNVDVWIGATNTGPNGYGYRDATEA